MFAAFSARCVIIIPALRQQGGPSPSEEQKVIANLEPLFKWINYIHKRK